MKTHKLLILKKGTKIGMVPGKNVAAPEDYSSDSSDPDEISLCDMSIDKSGCSK